VTVNGTRDYEDAHGFTYAEITVHGSVARADGRLAGTQYQRCCYSRDIIAETALASSTGLTVLISGYSQSVGALLEFLAKGLDPDRVYDAHLV
jgi:hypothetical protein